MKLEARNKRVGGGGGGGRGWKETEWFSWIRSAIKNEISSGFAQKDVGCNFRFLCLVKHSSLKVSLSNTAYQLKGWWFWPHPPVNGEPREEELFSPSFTLFIQPHSPWVLLGVDEERNAPPPPPPPPHTQPPFPARFFTLLPQLSWQCIPPALGSYRPHKLIRHLLESSADSEAGSFKANIFVRDDASSITFEGCHY